MPLLMSDNLNEFGQYSVQVATPEQIKSIVLARSEYEYGEGQSSPLANMSEYVDFSVELINNTDAGRDMEIWCVSNKQDAMDIPCAIWVLYREAYWIGPEEHSGNAEQTTCAKARTWVRGRGAYPGSLLTRPGLRGKGFARILCDKVIQYLSSQACRREQDLPLIALYGYTYIMSIFGPMGIPLQEPSMGLTIPFDHSFGQPFKLRDIEWITTDRHAYEVAAKHSSCMRDVALSKNEQPSLITPITRKDIELYLCAFSKQRLIAGRSFDEQLGVEFGEFGTDSWGYGLWRPQGLRGSWKIVSYHVSNAASMRILITAALQVAARSEGVSKDISIWSGWLKEVDMMKELGFQPETLAKGVERQIIRSIGLPETSDCLMQQTYWQHPQSMLYLKL